MRENFQLPGISANFIIGYTFRIHKRPKVLRENRCLGFVNHLTGPSSAIRYPINDPRQVRKLIASLNASDAAHKPR